jgi:hypothetical protein
VDARDVVAVVTGRYARAGKPDNVPTVNPVRVRSLVAVAALACATVSPRVAHALPPDFDGERGIEAGVSFGYGLYTNTSERLFWTANQAVIAGPPPVAIASGGANLRFHAGYRFMPLLSAGVYGELQWVGADQGAGYATTAFTGGVGVYARFYPAPLFNRTLDVRRVRFDGVASRRRLDPFVSLGIEAYHSIARERIDLSMPMFYADWNRRAVGIPLIVGAEVRVVPALAVGVQIGWTPLIGGTIDKTDHVSDGRGNVTTMTTQYESVDVFNSQFSFAVSARYTLTLF